MEESSNLASTHLKSIHYFYEAIPFRLDNEQTVSNWIQQVISESSFQLINLNYIFCSDSYLLEINKQYLDHNYLTDIITFNNADSTQVIEADLFISIDRVTENAKNLKRPLSEELYRVMVHGILHLIGFNDKTEQEQTLMREKENQYLEKIL